ncbi:MAG TPA: UvrD-helicase domain-containing protein, partial [Longimicrobiales bacterium]|nr:UvrD-helicase domain-containing protein [Longimicrobiales bacterium]
MAPQIPFPGPPALGRGLVIEPGDPVPAPAGSWPRATIDTDVLANPVDTLNRLHHWWRHRIPSVVELAVPFSMLRAPESIADAPYTLHPSFEFARERLHYLVWINRYDGRGGALRWHHGERALQVGAGVCADGRGEVVVDGEARWVDGGPRTARGDDLLVIHVESVWSGNLDPDRSSPPASDLAPDQLAAVSHAGGPARIIAPAGSGKTRVLTERFRHLVVDRGW